MANKVLARQNYLTQRQRSRQPPLVQRAIGERLGPVQSSFAAHQNKPSLEVQPNASDIFRLLLEHLHGDFMATFTSKRFTQLTLDTVAPEARDLAGDILKISSVGLAGPYNSATRCSDWCPLF